MSGLISDIFDTAQGPVSDGGSDNTAIGSWNPTGNRFLLTSATGPEFAYTAMDINITASGQCFTEANVSTGSTPPFVPFSGLSYNFSLNPSSPIYQLDIDIFNLVNTQVEVNYDYVGSTGFTGPFVTTATGVFSIPIPGLQITQFIVAFYSTVSVGFSQAYLNSINSSAVCLAKDSLVLLYDGTKKKIQDIIRGDLVASDPSISKIYRVARLDHQTYKKRFPGEMGLMVFDENSLGENNPSNKFIVSTAHSIYWNGSRYPADSFSGKGIKKYNNKGDYLELNGDKFEWNEIIPFNENSNTFTVYDLQFETAGSYVANGVKVQSRHPRSFNTPLPKELYFDKSLYTDKFANDYDEDYLEPFVIGQTIEI